MLLQQLKQSEVLSRSANFIEAACRIKCPKAVVNLNGRANSNAILNGIMRRLSGCNMVDKLMLFKKVLRNKQKKLVYLKEIRMEKLVEAKRVEALIRKIVNMIEEIV